MGIGIALNICQDDLIPWQASEDLCVLPCDLHASVISCAGMRGRPLCIRCSLCSDQFVMGLMRVWRGLELFLDDWCWSVLRVGSGPRGRRFRCCQRFLWRSSVVLTPLALLPSIFSWPPAAACPQPSPRSCPSLSKAWALTTSLAWMMEAACFRPEDKTKNGKTPCGATIR